MTTEPQPYFKTDWSPRRTQDQHDSADASSIAVREEMARNATLERPPITPTPVLQIKELVLPDDFQQRLSELDNRLTKHGIGISKEHFLSLGKERFEKLLAADRKARVGAIGAGVDLSDFAHVQHVIQAFVCHIVPARKTAEQAARIGKERDVARQISASAF